MRMTAYSVALVKAMRHGWKLHSADSRGAYLYRTTAIGQQYWLWVAADGELYGTESPID
jgi:hypothetical protein